MGKTQTEEKILRAARTEFLCCGYEGARMRTIADRAGTNKGLLHYYFRSKETLLVQVFQDTFCELFETMHHALLAHENVEDQIRAAVETYMDFIHRHPDLPFFIIQELRRDPQAHMCHMKEAGIRSPFAPLAQSLDKAKTAGRIRKDVNPQSVILNIVSLVLFPVLASGMVKFMNGMDDQNYQNFLRQRKREVGDFILRAIAEPDKIQESSNR